MIIYHIIIKPLRSFQRYLLIRFISRCVGFTNNEMIFQNVKRVLTFVMDIHAIHDVLHPDTVFLQGEITTENITTTNLWI